MEANNIFIFILELFGPETIYAQLDAASKIYCFTVAPAVIILSIATRYLELMHENLGKSAEWSKAIQDIKSAIIFTALYAAFGAVVIKFHQAFCAMMYKHSSIETIMGNYEQFLEGLKNPDDPGTLAKIQAKFSQYSVQAVVFQSTCLLSMILLALVNVLLRIVYALGFCMLYLWGMFAVPTMSSKLLNMTSGWFRGVVTLAVWPIVEATIYMLIGPMFAAWTEKMNAFQLAGARDIANTALLYTFANLVLMAVSLTAFGIAVVISMNQNFMAGLGATFMAAWAGGASLTMNAAKLLKPPMPGMSGAGASSPTGGGGASPSAASKSLDGLQGGGQQSGQSSANGGSAGGESSSGSKAGSAGGGGQSATGGASPMAESATQSSGGQQAASSKSANPLSKPGNSDKKGASGNNKESNTPGANPAGSRNAPQGAAPAGQSGSNMQPNNSADLNDLKR